MDVQVLEAFDTAQLIPDFNAPQLPSERPDRATLDAAEHNTRHWTSREHGPLVPGSDVHRRETCRMFRETFNPYRPSVLEWPSLEPAALKRIVELPIWDIAVQTEGKARLRMAAYAATVDDADMRAVLALNAWEENRHKEVLSRMVQAYGIVLASEPPYVYPKDAEWAYLVTGYSECVDSFFAFGLFEVARRSGLFPPELIDTFEPVMQEECRHILLFANWVAWHRARLSWWRRIAFELKVARVWAFLGWERIGLARTMDAEGNEHQQDNNFTVNGAQSVSDVDINVPDLMCLCLEENDRRFSGYDTRLLRPETMPKLVRFALRFMRPRPSTPSASSTRKS
ncbi:ferritin-like domain-containing protein [Paraburkholderia tagetis]|uniref:Ferritin-like domain-containing protein n=1 Tax=Paraburkholderia tagetis TaxID=2913261 RepID=A0A9X1RPK2_9BURK|nr:ferritin-like domain-containing protein [Paraburkholderia tagetis]MCG5073964.1 ferritin-like domain-containing protein [Paraburkholderia tagetis]